MDGNHKPKMATLLFLLTLALLLTLTARGHTQAPLKANAGPNQEDVGFDQLVQLAGGGSGGEGDLTFHWRQLHGPSMILSDPNLPNPRFTTPTLEQVLTPAERKAFTIVALSPDEKEVVLELTVTDSQGETAIDQVIVSMTSTATGGLSTVGVGTEVFLTGKEQEGYNWTVSEKPFDSGGGELTCPSQSDDPAECEASEIRTPVFIPDVPGVYVIEEINSGSVIRLVASLWSGERFDCRRCHNGKRRPDLVTPWLKTGHAGFFARGVDGRLSLPYDEECIRCHTIGHEKKADNGGFDDVQLLLGWRFPERLLPGNFRKAPPRLQNLANIQCESCHGPGSEHGGRKEAISVSLRSGVCQQCHAGAPYLNRDLNRGVEWENSKHSVLVENPAFRGECIPCHTAQGFVRRVKGKLLTRLDDPQPQTCAACHDPHSARNEHQLRIAGKIALPDGTRVEADVAAICYACHNSRRNPATLAASGRLAPHFGPQGEMLEGTGAFEVGNQRYDSSFHGSEAFVLPELRSAQSRSEKCVTCHMAPGPAEGEPGHHQVGGHSFNMHTPEPDDGSEEGEDEGEDESEEVQNVAICRQCHRGLAGFNRPAAADYDGDGVREGVQTEVDHLLDILAGAIADSLAGGIGDGLSGSFVEEEGRFIFKNSAGQEATPTDAQYKAAYNHHFVRNDGSHGIHNTAYALQLLQRSYRNLTGQDIPGAALR